MMFKINNDYTTPTANTIQVYRQSKSTEILVVRAGKQFTY